MARRHRATLLALVLALPAAATDGGRAPLVPEVSEALLEQLGAQYLTAIDQQGVSLRRLDTGAELFQVNGQVPRRIASVSKIFTSFTALERLGTGYRFRTAFLADGVEGTSVENLYIKGYGDPFLVSEEWRAIAQALPVRQVRGAIVVDDSFFAPQLELVDEPGVANAYNARNAAFASNFNTLKVRVAGAQVSGEPQTPLTPFTVFDVRPRSGGVLVDVERRNEELWVHLRGPFARQAGSVRFHLGDDPSTPALYAGHLFGAIFEQEGGVRASRGVRRGAVPATAQPVLLHESSRSLRQVVAELFRYSNNFIANQLFLVMAAELAGAPATVAAGRQVLQGEVDAVVGPGLVELHEGSGLDPRNRASPSVLTAYLQAMWRRDPQLVELLQPRNAGRVRAKTGTYVDNGVRSLVGFLVDGKGRSTLAVALLCDGPRCSRETLERFDALLDDWAAVLAPADAPALFCGLGDDPAELPSELLGEVE